MSWFSNCSGIIIQVLIELDWNRLQQIWKYIDYFNLNWYFDKPANFHMFSILFIILFLKTNSTNHVTILWYMWYDNKFDLVKFVCLVNRADAPSRPLSTDQWLPPVGAQWLLWSNQGRQRSTTCDRGFRQTLCDLWKAFDSMNYKHTQE